MPRCPHGDTLNYADLRSNVTQVQEVVSGMTETLIRCKALYRHRLLDRYFLVVMDGTGMLTYTERHCPHCMTRTYNGRTLYYHPVLEAKLVTETGWSSRDDRVYRELGGKPHQTRLRAESFLPSRRTSQASLASAAHLSPPGWVICRRPNLLHLRTESLEVSHCVAGG